MKDTFQTESTLRALWKNGDQELSNLEKELQEQTSKLQRAEKQLHRVLREVRGMCQTKLLALLLVSLAFYILKFIGINIIIDNCVHINRFHNVTESSEICSTRLP
jgi:hypothetical protein